jgi:hypothetical protein
MEDGMENRATHLKCMANGRVFPYSKTLMEGRKDMMPCDANGHIAPGIVDVSEATEATINRKKTPYLGNPENGVLYPYRPLLAELPHMMSIDSPSQWKNLQDTGQVPMTPRNTIVPNIPEEPITLTRAKPADKVAEVAEVAEVAGASVPNIEGMGVRDAKTALMEWAETKFHVKLDRRQGLAALVEECETLATPAAEKVTG